MSDPRPPELPPTHTMSGASPADPYGPPPPGYPGVPPAGSHGPQPPYGGRPPRQDNALKVVLIVLGTVGLLVLGGCLAVVGLVAKSVDEATESIEVGEQRDLVEGQAFALSGFTYAEGWSLRRDELRLLDVVRLRATNETGGSTVAVVDLTVHRGDRLLARATCASEPVDAGESVELRCSSLDRLPRWYDRISVSGGAPVP